MQCEIEDTVDMTEKQCEWKEIVALRYYFNNHTII